MYRAIALVLLAATISAGGALAVVMVQTSSVKRPLPPQMALGTPLVSTKPRISQRPDATVQTAPLATQKPAPERPVETDTARRKAPTAPIHAKPAQLARAPSIMPALPKPLQKAPVQVPLSPYAAFTLENTQPAPVQAPQALGLTDAPVFSGQTAAKTWSIGVYR